MVHYAAAGGIAQAMEQMSGTGGLHSPHNSAVVRVRALRRQCQRSADGGYHHERVMPMADRLRLNFIHDLTHFRLYLRLLLGFATKAGLRFRRGFSRGGG